MTEHLHAGAAMTDITPAMGIQIAGDIGRLRPTEEIREPLFARALALESDGRRVVILSLDIMCVTARYDAVIRAEAARRFGLAPDALLIHAVQNHAAPAIGHLACSDAYPLPEALWFVRGGDERYNAGAIDSILTAIGEALARLEPVAMRAARGVDGRVAFNRRFLMRDGSVRTHPALCDPEIVCTEGPVDPEVAVVTFEGARGPVAALLHFTCHPVHGYPERWVSGGWPGWWCRGVQALLGDGCVPLVLNGACGNIHHTNYLDPEFRDDYQAMGDKLTQTAARIIARLAPLPSAPVAPAWQTLALPLRALDADALAAAERLLTEHPEPIWLDDAHTAIHWDWVYAVAQCDLRDTRARRPHADVPIQVLRLGDLALVAVAGEPFVELQLNVKRRSPARYTLMAHMSNGSVGYLPTREALRRGGYETRTATWSQFAPEALEMIEETAVTLLDGLFSNTPLTA
jgi:hypothetical protein